MLINKLILQDYSIWRTTHTEGCACGNRCGNHGSYSGSIQLHYLVCLLFVFLSPLRLIIKFLLDSSISTQGGIGPAGLSAEDLHVLDLTQQRPRWHRLDSENPTPQPPFLVSFAICFVKTVAYHFVELLFKVLDLGHVMDMSWHWQGKGISWRLVGMMVSHFMICSLYIFCSCY